MFSSSSAGSRHPRRHVAGHQRFRGLPGDAAGERRPDPDALGSIRHARRRRRSRGGCRRLRDQAVRRQGAGGAHASVAAPCRSGRRPGRRASFRRRRDRTRTPARCAATGDEVPLTKTEFRLLCELARNAGLVLSREQLLDRVWGYDYLGDGRTRRRARAPPAHEDRSRPVGPRARRDREGTGVSHEPPMTTEGERARRRSRGLRFRLVVLFAIGGLVLSSVFALGTYSFAKRYLVSQRERTAQRQAFLDDAHAFRGAFGADRTSVADALAALEVPTGTSVVIRKDGRGTARRSRLGETTYPPSSVRSCGPGWSRPSTHLDGRSDRRSRRGADPTTRRRLLRDRRAQRAREHAPSHPRHAASALLRSPRSQPPCSGSGPLVACSRPCAR